MGPNCQVCHGNLTTFWRPGVLEFFGGQKGLSRRALGGPNLQDTRLFIDSDAFWGSKSVGYQAFYRFKCVLGSKSIGYQAFYRFKCVLGVQIYRIPGFLSIQMCFWGSNSANFADRERSDPFIYRVWGLCANRFSETRRSTAGPYSLNFRSAFYKSTVKLGI